ncbi:hypothetical protein AZE42_05288 [Rhizopogon vesiculosus]|uniref:Peptidase A1 domain-containing protein n=1 Tax=Rhizopogon vesiculosus TaxID=180088 RepID=A0A1J8PYU9_9AGAM|nr:hypothetical protein AZE42_05288 [Rhizopogon vesiculosus]
MSHVVIRSVPFTTSLRAAQGGAKELIQRDRARAQKFLAGESAHGPLHFVDAHRRRHGHHHKETAPSDATTTAPSTIDVSDSGVTYIMQVGVGNPATQHALLIDTGSSNTWIGANTTYKPTSTSHSTGNTVNVSYGSGSMTGKEYTDTVTLGANLVIKNQSIGVASSTQDFQDVDGILGVGPADLTQGTVSNTTSVPTVTDNLYAQGTIPSDSIGISYEPSSTANVSNGEITFGGTDSTKYTGQMNFVPLTTTSPASKYWGINQSVSYGTGNTILQTTAGIVDTGTTLLLLATNAFQAYQKATGATLDQSSNDHAATIRQSSELVV